jgi:hypothetical protein
MAKSFWRMLAVAMTIPPIYAPIKGPSDASLADGWKIAYEQEKARRIEAEKAMCELMLMPAVTEEDRNELACLLTEYSREDWDGRSERSPVKYYSLKDADRLLAAGYRKVAR